MSEPKKISSLQEISAVEVKDALISGLRDRPNSTSIYGAKGLTADELKKQHDKYPEILRARFNELVKTIKESLDNADGNGSQIAEEIMVKLNESADSTSSLDEAIQDLFEMIKENEDFMLGVIGDASEYTSTIIADIEQLMQDVEGAMNKANEAEGYATTAQIDARDAKTKAKDAYNFSQSATSNALRAIDAVDTMYDILEGTNQTVEEAKTIAERAESIAKGANQAKVFQSEAGMLNSLPANVYEGLELPAGSTIIVSADAADSTVYCNLWINGEQFLSFVGADTKYNRDYAYYILPETITVETFDYLFESFDGEVGLNWRCAWTKQTLDYNSITNTLLAPNDIPVGTNLYIRDTGVPDYWWDGEKPCELETQKVNLTPIEEGLRNILHAINSIL